MSSSLFLFECRLCKYELRNQKARVKHERDCLKGRQIIIKDEAIKRIKELGALLEEIDATFSGKTDTMISKCDWGVLEKLPIDPDSDSDTETVMSVDDSISISRPSTLVIPLDTMTRKITQDIIKIQYHDASGRATERLPINEYTRRRNEVMGDGQTRSARTPADYELVRTSLACGLSEEQIDAIINYIRKITLNGDLITLRNHIDLRACLEGLLKGPTAIQEVHFGLPYKNTPKKFKVFYRSLWEWMKLLVADPEILPLMHWDASKIYKYESELGEFVRIFDEPWTAERFWEIQSSLPRNGKPFCILLSVRRRNHIINGTEMDFEIIARCANLPIKVRNGKGIGGGIVVGSLPAVRDIDQEKKIAFGAYISAVWQQAFHFVLKSIEAVSKTGQLVPCADGVQRRIYPCILIISATYNIQYRLTTVRQLSSRSCPCCEAVDEELLNEDAVFSPRSTEKSKALYELSLNVPKMEREKFLITHGVAPVYNVLWKYEKSDPHAIVSWSGTQEFRRGLFARNLWEEFKARLELPGPINNSDINDGFRQFPAYEGLQRFKTVISASFEDAKPYGDIAKMLVYATHRLFELGTNSPEYILLRAIRSFSILDTLLSLEMQTSATVATGRSEFGKLVGLVKEYITLYNGESKIFLNKLELHIHYHVFDDIMRKGVTHNYDSKLNFGLGSDEVTLCNDEANKSMIIEDTNLTEYQGVEQAPPSSNDVFHFGANSIWVRLSDLEGRNNRDAAFTQIRDRIYGFFVEHLNIVPSTTDLEEVMEFRRFDINYISKVNYERKSESLFSDDVYFGENYKHRFDFVMVNTDEGLSFARVVTFFAIWIDEKPYPLVLVQILVRYLGPKSARDEELGLLRLCLPPRSSSQILLAESIIRRALLVKDTDEEYLVVDTVDGDMYLRQKGILLKGF